MSKRILSVILSLILLLSMSAMAEINMDSQWPVVTEPGASIDLAVCVAGSDGKVADMWLFKWLQEVSGIEINVTGITKDAWETRKNLIMTSGELADVYWGFNWSTTDLYYYGSEGDFIALNDLIDQYGKNLKGIDEYIGHDKMLGAAAAPDGNIYGIPVMTEPAADMLNRTTWGMSINTTMLDAIGAEIPTTLEELREVLVKLNEAGYNGTISAQYEGNPGSEFRSLTLAAYQIITEGNVKDNIALKQTAPDVWEPIYIGLEPEYKEWLVMMNQLYTEGLIDQSFFTADMTARAAKNQENPAAVIVSTLDQSLGENPDQFKQYQVFLLNEDDTLAPITYNVNHTAPGGFVITSACEYPEEAMALIDRLYDCSTMLTIANGPYVNNPDEYTDLAKEYGIGYDFTKDENGNFVSFIQPNIEAQNSGMTNGEYLRAHVNPSAVYNNFYPISGLYARVKLYNAPARNVGDPNDRAIAWFRTQQQANIPNIAYKFPDVYLTMDAYERALELKGEIEDYLYSMEGRFISGELSIEENYDAFIDQLKALGVEEYLGIYSDAYALLAK